MTLWYNCAGEVATIQFVTPPLMCVHSVNKWCLKTRKTVNPNNSKWQQPPNESYLAWSQHTNMALPFHGSTIPYHIQPPHLSYSTILYHTLPYSTILYHTLPHLSYSTILCHTLPYSAILLPYSTILYHTLPYSTKPYCSLPS